MELSLTISSRNGTRNGGGHGGRIDGPFGDSTIVEVDGEIDMATSPQLRSRLVEVINGGCRSLVVDFSRVDFVDSTGLGVLVGARRRLSSVDGELTLIVPPGPVRNLFAITELDTIFTIDESIPSPAER